MFGQFKQQVKIFLLQFHLVKMGNNFLAYFIKPKKVILVLCRQVISCIRRLIIQRLVQSFMIVELEIFFQALPQR
jgi:hypothetical protein